jgi:membrane-associated protease RseP (regulator of RpoE activity)
MHLRSSRRVSITLARLASMLLGLAAAARAGAAEPPRSDLRPAGEVAAAERNAPVAGMTLVPVPALLRNHLVLPEGAGLVVREVAAGSAAEAAGLRVHDVLVFLDGQAILRPDHLAALVAAAGPEAPLVLEVRRAGRQLNVSLNPSRSSGSDSVPPQPGAPAALAEPPPGAAPIPTTQPIIGPVAAAPSAPFVPPPGARRLGPDAVLLEEGDYWLKVYRAADTCLMARDARGWLVFNGPISTPQQRSLIPRQVRDRVAKLELMLDAVAAPPTTPSPPAVAAGPTALPPSAAKPAPAPTVTAPQTSVAAPPASVGIPRAPSPQAPAAATIEPGTEIGRLDVDPIEIR